MLIIFWLIMALLILSYILNIHKYLMVKNNIKIMYGHTKNVFNTLLSLCGSLAHIAKVSDHTKCIFPINEPCLATPTLINLNSSELHYYTFVVCLDRCDRNSNTLAWWFIK